MKFYLAIIFGLISLFGLMGVTEGQRWAYGPGWGPPPPGRWGYGRYGYGGYQPYYRGRWGRYGHYGYGK